MIASTAASGPGAARNPVVTVVVENVRNSTGVIGVLVFNSARGWPEAVKYAFRRKAVPAHPGPVTLTFTDLPPGDYGVVVLHDENENMKLDRNFFGRPREGWGMSNNPKPHASAPSFERARFALTRDTVLRVHLRY